MSATSLDLSQIKTDALSAAASFRTLIGLGSGNTPTFLGASLTGGTVTASAPLINATQTWNNAGTVFTGILANVTDTASSSSSLLMDLQTGGVSRFSVNKSGTITGTRTLESGNLIDLKTTGYSFGLTVNFQGGLTCTSISTGNITWAGNNGADASFIYGPTLALRGTGSAYITDCLLTRDAAQTLAQRNSTNAQTFRIYNTFTDASNYERGKLEWASNVLRIGTEKAGTGSARALELQTDGVTRLTIGTAGLFTIADALDIAVGTTTGTKIGTATTQKLAFWNATPVVQPTAVADATDAASVITQLNALLSRMRTLGLIAT
jgi:hypothetical protein